MRMQTQTVRARNRTRSLRGQGPAELMAGLMLLVIIGLFSLDLIAVVLGQIANESLAKSAARSLASVTRPTADAAPDLQEASRRRDKFREKFANSATVRLDQINYLYTNDNDEVQVETRVVITLPVPVPLLPKLSTVRLSALAVEPVVGHVYVR